MINKLGIMKKGKVWRKVAFALGMLVFLQGQAQKRTFVHPGITYTQADLDRMKAMVEARQEPFYTTFQHMLKDGYSQIGDGNYADITQIKEGKFNGTIGADGRRAHDMALLYHITGNKAYADDAVKRLNRYNRLVNASSRGTAPLDNGKIYLRPSCCVLMKDGVRKIKKPSRKCWFIRFTVLKSRQIPISHRMTIRMECLFIGIFISSTRDVSAIKDCSQSVA